MLESCEDFEGFVLVKASTKWQVRVFYYVETGSGYKVRCMALFSKRGWKLQFCDAETEGLFV